MVGSTRRMGWPELFERARQRGGFVVRQDPAECGVDIDEFDRRASRERWPRPYVGVRLPPGGTLTPHTRVLAALASVKGEVAADRWTAAWLLGGRSRPTAAPMLIVPRNRRPNRQDNLEIRRTAVWLPEHMQVVRGVRLLGPPRLVVDLVHVGVQPRPMRDITFRLSRSADLRSDQLREVAGAYSRLHNRDVLDDLIRLLDTVGSESGLENLVRERLVEEGFDPDALQLTIDTVNGRRRLDIVFGDAKVGIEVQSVEYHGDQPAMTRDARKLNAFQVDAVWAILLFTPAMLEGDLWLEFVGNLRELLTSRTPD